MSESGRADQFGKEVRNGKAKLREEGNCPDHPLIVPFRTRTHSLFAFSIVGIEDGDQRRDDDGLRYLNRSLLFSSNGVLEY